MMLFREGKTVGRLIVEGSTVLEAAGIENWRFEATLILLFAGSLRREDLIREPERVLGAREQLIFDKALALRAERRPLAYITGEQWFYGRPFKVNRAVLIPRPETEMLVDYACEAYARIGSLRNVADIGTGSGCLAVSIAAELPTTKVFAVDISRQALLVAKKNVIRHGVEDRVQLLEGDLLAPLAGQKMDLIVSNPPYIRPIDVAGLMPEVGTYEPASALWVGTGDDGMLIHRRLIDGAHEVLTDGGWLAMEVGQGQADSVRLYAGLCGYKPVYVLQDLGGIDRVVAMQWSH